MQPATSAILGSLRRQPIRYTAPLPSSLVKPTTKPSFSSAPPRSHLWLNGPATQSARLLAQSGARVSLHGRNSCQPDGADVRSALRFAGISPDDTARLLDRDGITFLPIDNFAPRVLDLLRLRDVLGLRSCINTVCRMMNPAQAGAAVQGVFHPPHRDLQQAAGTLLGQPDLCILKGGGGEFECHPRKDITLFRLQSGQPLTTILPELLPETRRLVDDPHPPQALAALWAGQLQDHFSQAVVTGTAAAALITLGHPPATAQAKAETLWSARPIFCPPEEALP